mgnify:CR=1 FL=1
MFREDLDENGRSLLHYCAVSGCAESLSVLSKGSGEFINSVRFGCVSQHQHMGLVVTTVCSWVAAVVQLFTMP